MYTKSALYYDAIYSGKDYEQEALTVHRFIRQYQRCFGNALLDIACGTGSHLVHLRKYYTVMGLDINPHLLAIARCRCPDVKFYEADMTGFDLGIQVDAITCLFSAIGYVRTAERLCQTIRTMARHLKPGGVLIVEPWFTPDSYKPGTVHARFIDQPDLKIARMTVSAVEGRISRNDFHFMIGTPQGVTQFVERHELGLFSHEEYGSAFQDGGLDVIHVPAGLTGRGLYIGMRPLE